MKALLIATFITAAQFTAAQQQLNTNALPALVFTRPEGFTGVVSASNRDMAVRHWFFTNPQRDPMKAWLEVDWADAMLKSITDWVRMNSETRDDNSRPGKKAAVNIAQLMAHLNTVREIETLLRSVKARRVTSLASQVEERLSRVEELRKVLEQFQQEQPKRRSHNRE